VSVTLEHRPTGVPGISDVGGWVVTLIPTLPFLISDAGMACEPVTSTGAGFCPGTLHSSPGLQHSPVGFAVAVTVISTSVLPRPARTPVVVSVSPLPVIGED